MEKAVRRIPVYTVIAAHLVYAIKNSNELIHGHAKATLGVQD